MAASLVKYANRNKAPNGQNLYWNREVTDGLPFRGTTAPHFTEEEFDARVQRVADFRNAFFRVDVPEENKAYLDVMECCANGWFQMCHLERFWVAPDGNRTMTHYVEWYEFYLEDGSRTPFTHPGVQELASGQQYPFGHS